MHHRENSLKSSEQYICLLIDGMDQKEACLPHMHRLPKDVNDECLVQMHLVGCLAYNGLVKPIVFITYPNPLPLVLYIQLDNTTRENKNSTIFRYLSMLVN